MNDYQLLKFKKDFLTGNIQKLKDHLNELTLELSTINAEISKLQNTPNRNDEEVFKEKIMPCDEHHKLVLRYLNSNRQATTWTDRANAILSLVSLTFRGSLPTHDMVSIALNALTLDSANLGIPKNIRPDYTKETVRNQFSKLNLSVSKDANIGYTIEMRNALQVMVQSFPNIPRSLFDVSVTKLSNKSVSAICQQLYNTHLLVKSYNYIACNHDELNELLIRATHVK